MQFFKRRTSRPTKEKVDRLSNHYRSMILKNKTVELMKQEDYNNLIDVAKYAEFGRSTAIQAAFYLGYFAGKEGGGTNE